MNRFTRSSKKYYKIFIQNCDNYNYSDETMKKRTIGDFVAGMTDRYAIEFYCRLFSESPESIFKPI